jgi:molybdopterin/thiamine biosynthesis adenylyltransferase
VLVINLKGLATETIKNIVLAGIGKLVVLDGENVAEEDLGAGFFFRGSDVGNNVIFFRFLCSLGFLLTQASAPQLRSLASRASTHLLL